MQPTVDSQSARDELYRRIGRNVVNFQYLEATLRSMVPMLYNKSTLKELQAHQSEVSPKQEKSTFGTLVSSYHERLSRSKELLNENVPDEGLDEPTLTFGLSIEVTEETAAQRRSALVNLVAERNRLIHEDLLNVDLKSREECEELSARLDEQYTRIRRHLDHFNSLRTNFQEMAAEFGRLLESDEFRALLSGEREDPDSLA
jgi:alanyl-tRNA synthetase